MRLHVNREGVRQLHAEGQAELICLALQTLQHRNSVLPLQVCREVMIIERDIVKTEPVQRPARILVAQKRRIALDERVQLFRLQHVGGDGLDLCRRTAVQG